MPFTDSELLDEIKRLLDERDDVEDENKMGSNFTSLSDWAIKNSAQGQKGQKTPRMNLAIDTDVYEYIRAESRKLGMTYSEFICAVMRQRGNFIKIDESQDAWQKNFELYKEFQTSFAREPQYREVYNGVNLENWVKMQRLSFKTGSLSKERMQNLLEVGFVFDPLEDVWEKHFELYKAFKAVFLREPRQLDVYDGFKIGLWAAAQRYAFKKGTLSDDRKKKLSEIGFFE